MATMQQRGLDLKVDPAAAKLTCRCHRSTPRCVPPSGRSASASAHKAFFPSSVPCDGARIGCGSSGDTKPLWQTTGRRAPLLASEVRLREQRTLPFKAEQARFVLVFQERKEKREGYRTRRDTRMIRFRVRSTRSLANAINDRGDCARASRSSGLYKLPRSAFKRRKRGVATPARA